MSTYTDEQIIAAARAAVEEKGADYVYPRLYGPSDCMYSQDGAPSCIVGHVFNRLSPEAFEAVVQWERVNEESGRVWEVLDALERNEEIDPLALTERQRNALQVAQDLQDGGMTWAYALDGLERNLR